MIVPTRKGWFVHRLVVPHAPDSASVVRHQVVAELRARGVDPQVVDDAAVVVSELVGNAIRHGRPLRDGTLSAGWNVNRSTFHIEVEDGGGGLPEVVQLPDHDVTSGRGLVLVEALCRSWGVRATADGTSVWAEVPLSGQALLAVG